ncbi:hypothetical protein DFS34DRAFT_9880 [Phlyctochytrium arcticum]|nr:hypothetical protein DFS34DRAFT_9880 [Phlyctochytrium arcticum]
MGDSVQGKRTREATQEHLSSSDRQSRLNKRPRRERTPILQKHSEVSSSHQPSSTLHSSTSRESGAPIPNNPYPLRTSRPESLPQASVTHSSGRVLDTPPQRNAAGNIIDLTGDTPTSPGSPSHRAASQVIDLSSHADDSPSVQLSTRGNTTRRVLDLTNVDDDADIQVLHHKRGIRRNPSLVRADSLRDLAFMLGAQRERMDYIGPDGVQSDLSNNPFSMVNRSLERFRTPNPTGYSVPRRVPAYIPRASPEPENPAALKCAVCLSTFGSDTQLSSTICGHIFCQDCIGAAVKSQGKCPICRRNLKGKNSVHRLYLST